jgi:uncharacterized membrane protein
LTSSAAKGNESNFEQAISYLLGAGVVSSLVLVGTGIFFYYLDFGSLAISEKKALFLQEKDFFYFLYDLLRGGHSLGRALWTLTLGIAVLILTPYLRVLLSVFYFLREKDFKFFFITLFVFLILTLSLAAR